MSADRPAITPHVALLLPLNSPAFGRHADAVRQGFASAAKVAGAGAPPIRVYPVNEDTINVLTIYEQAIETGARLVVGPLTRSGVAALAASNLVTVPTLALNGLEAKAAQPARMYLFGLAMESEARQLARMAFAGGKRAFVVVDSSLLSQRLRQAFAEEFARLGGMVAAEYQFTSDRASLARLREATNLGVAESIFLAIDHSSISAVRAFLGNSAAIFATSQANNGRGASRELNRVRFVDMPWFLQADHPAVMVYPRPTGLDDVELERFYALGIDAYRVGVELLRKSGESALDGVTGRIRLGHNQQFTRELTPAQFVDGKTVVTGESRP